MVIDSRLGAVTVAFAVATTGAILFALPIAGLALVWRLRAARGERRQQLRWIATSGVAVVAAAIIAIVAVALSWGGPSPWLADVPLFLAYLSVPLCTGVAILRYRLYDIDVIINRAVVLVVVAVFVTTGYVAVVVGTGVALGQRVEGRFWPSLLALAMVALAFQPLRSRVLRWADRLAYGDRAGLYEALADFSRQIGAVASPDQLLPLFAEAAGRGVGAFRAWVHVDVPGTAGLSASWPNDAVGIIERPSDVQVTITDRGAPLGVLSVRMKPGRPVRGAERRLLESFAEQAGLALRNIRLEAQLRMRVAEAAAQSTAMEAARRRLVGARDAERQRVAETINQTVLARLEPLVPALGPDQPVGPEATADLLRRLDMATGASLEALRQVTHGLFPAVLNRRGLVPALRDHLATVGAVDVLQARDSVADHRFPAATEAAGYYCCLASLAEMARPAHVRLALRDGLLIVDVEGPAKDLAGSGPAQQAWFADPVLLADRVEAAGGLLRRDRSPDGVLVVHAELPAPTGSTV
jgi:signal transduction histidine kinase